MENNVEDKVNMKLGEGVCESFSDDEYDKAVEDWIFRGWDKHYGHNVGEDDERITEL